MPALLTFCLKFSVSIGLVFLFYQLVLRKLTFYNWNRYYLLGYTLLAFIVAFVDISPMLQQKELAENGFVKWIPVLNSSEIASNNISETDFFTPWNMISLVFVFGMIIMFFRLMIQLFSFRRLIKRAEPISVGEMKFYQVNESIIPFSFGKSVFINRNLHTNEELQEIIRHEFVHVKQKHSIDIIIGEILCLFNWYNPFAWLLRTSIRQNLEFIADNKVLENGINKKEYQYLLLKVIGNNQFSIASKFNFSSLKKRIAMMNKLKSARLNLVRFLFVFPLIVVLLLAFRNKGMENPVLKPKTKEMVSTFQKNVITDTTPKSERSKSSATEENLSRISDDFEITNDRAVIHLKNGKTEEYDLKNKEQIKKFEKKYGKIVSANVHNGPMTTVSVVTADGVKTAIAPVKVVTATSSKTITVNPDVKAVTVVGVPTKAITVSPDIKAVTVVGKPLTVATKVNSTVVSDVSIGSNVTIRPDVEIIRDADIVVAIKNTTTPEELEGFISKLKEQGYELAFTNKNYKDGILSQLSGTIKYKDNSSTFSFSDFKEATIVSYREGDKVIFKIYTGKKKVTT